MVKAAQKREKKGGKLRIGDDWNAITIIALSQSSPLKAIAELVENSIDARAHNIIITRSRSKGGYSLKIEDDGDGVRLNDEGHPDFHYVATHICDSIKRELKRHGTTGIQGEYGIGLLSFWTLGEELKLSCPGKDRKLHQMEMQRGRQTYKLSARTLTVPLHRC